MRPHERRNSNNGPKGPPCPSCGTGTIISAPAEPDVGIMLDLFACREHGQFFIEHDGSVHFTGNGGSP